MSPAIVDSTIILAGSSPLLRTALGQLIQSFGAELTAEVSTSEGALGEVRQSQFDLFILLYDSAAGLGLDLLDRLEAELPSLPVLVINLSPSDHEAMTIIQTRVDGYIGRKGTAEHLRQALTRILAGKKFVSPAIAEKLVFQLGAFSIGGVEQKLSPRERQVLGLMAQGKKRSEMAKILRLSPQTISSYRSRLLDKLGLETNAELIRYAVDKKLI